MIDLTPVCRDLERSGCTLEQLWLDHASIWQGLGWGQAQVRLWLRCQPHIEVDQSDAANPTCRLPAAAGSHDSDLADQIVALLESAGRPMPLIQVMNRLPPGTIVTEPMLRAVIHADPRLVMTGPLVKRQ